MAEYEQQNMPYRSYNVKLKDALLQVGYMHPILSDKGKNIFLYGGISALGGNDNGTVFKTNDRYPPTKDVFRLCTPNCYPTARRLMYMWRMASVRFSSLPLVSTTNGKRVRVSLYPLASKNITHSTSKRCTFLREVRHIVTETYELKNLPNHVNFSYFMTIFAMSYQRFVCFLNITL